MKEKELEFFIRQGEGYNLEFKESFSNSLSLGRDICAFANANGGKILLGVDDDGMVKGIKITNRLKSQIFDLTRNFDPPVTISLDKVANVLVVNIPEGINKPYSVQGKFYMRYGPNSQQLTRNEIKEFFKKEGLILFDEKPNPYFDLKKDFDKNRFRKFLEMSKISPLLKKTAILDNLSLLRDGFLKNAGVLLFCHSITKFFSNATIVCVLYQGKTKYKILDRKEFNADVYANFHDAVIYLQSKLNTEFIIEGGVRKERLELPEDALREALLNAISHRDYFSNANILVEIFSDRVEITNPGGLVKGITKKDLGRKSLSRNNLLFGLLQRVGLVEKVGSGIVRMKKAMENYGLEVPYFDITDDWFAIIFKRQLKKGFPEKFPEKFPEASKRILEMVAQNPSITIEEMADVLRISDRAVKKHIAKLKKEGMLRRVGPAKGGHWEVIGR